MKDFAVFLRGENYLLEFPRKPPRKHEFILLQYIEAEDEVQAEQKALQLVRSDAELVSLIRNAVDDPPSLRVENIWPATDKLAMVKRLGTHFVFKDAEAPDSPEPAQRGWRAVASWFKGVLFPGL